MVAGYAVGLLMANMAVYVMAMGQVRKQISCPVAVLFVSLPLAACRAMQPTAVSC